MKKFFSLLIIVIIIGAAVVGAMVNSFLESPVSTDTTPIIISVDPGQTLRSVSAELESLGAVSDSRKFYWFGRFKSADKKIRVGEYAVAASMTPAEVLNIIVSGKSIERPITVTEGMNIFEISEQVEKQKVAKKEEFLRLVKDQKLIKELLGEEALSLEGYLFPETYNVTKFTTADALIRMMVGRFMDVFADVPKTTMTRRQHVTLASIIEKETGAPEERAVISSVFHNRMIKGMRLQTDPTVVYGIFFNTGKWDKNISKNDLLTDTIFNTYTRYGLPPGPIANPGREALIAAAKPATTNFLYFVSRNDGTHVFSPTYEAHNAAVKSFQMNRKAREGKSWRDLQKRPVPTGTEQPARN